MHTEMRYDSKGEGKPCVMQRSSAALMVLLLLTSSAPAIDAAGKG